MTSNSDLFDRKKLNLKPLEDRISNSDVSSMLDLNAPLPQIPPHQFKQLEKLASAIHYARTNEAPVILIYGAHLFRNGLSPFITKLMESGLINHVVTNGAGAIHDWEMAFQGQTTEDVKRYLNEGQFGLWEETGFYINLAIILGASNGLGLGESIGKMMSDGHLDIPDPGNLREELMDALNDATFSADIPAKMVLLKTIEEFNLKTGSIEVKHPFRDYSLIYNAYRLNRSISVCPGIGYDIIYTHPINNGSAVGKGGLQDFLCFTQSISKLNKGVLISVGSAVMAPQITEKALSMARNLALQNCYSLDDFYIAIVDLQPGDWDWSKGEPEKGNPAYYLRFCKSFSRMGGEFHYFNLDNRVFIQHLYELLSHGSD
jgi:hypothetical protein